MNSLLRSASVLALFAAALAASAQTTVSGGTATYNGFTDYTAQLGSLSKFDPTLGTLTNVALNAIYIFDSTITVTATAASTGTVATRSAAKFSSSDSAVNAALNATVNTATPATIGASTLNPTAFDLTGAEPTYSLAAGNSQQYRSSAGGQNIFNVSAARFAAFLATPTSTTFVVSGTTLTGLILNATSGNANASQQTTGRQTISVLYTYTPTPQSTPEPATLAALGLGAVALVKRRKK